MRSAAFLASTLVVPVTNAAKVSDGSSPTEEVKPSSPIDSIARAPPQRAVVGGAVAEAVLALEVEVGELAAARDGPRS